MASLICCLLLLGCFLICCLNFGRNLIGRILHGILCIFIYGCRFFIIAGILIKIFLRRNVWLFCNGIFSYGARIRFPSVSGIVIAAVCLFFVPPLGEIASSAISIVSELLVLCGAILGVKASYDVKFRKFEAELQDVIDNEKKLNTQTDNE